MLKLSRYQMIAVTDLRSGAMTYKIYLRGRAGGRSQPLVTGLASRQEAQAKIEEMEQAETAT